MGRDASEEEAWPLHLLHIFFGYALVILPTALFIQYVKRRKSDLHNEERLFWRLARAFAVGRPEYSLIESMKAGFREEEKGKNLVERFLLLAAMFTGIQVTLVTMGYLQERVITKPYQRLDDPEKADDFTDAQFLVFCNRIVALIICFIYIALTSFRQPPHVPAFYKHSYTSLSNTISSWCQYEALKYVSFPTQTICKASKVVATMLMGVVVRKQSYTWSEYMCGVGIAVGASLFLLEAPPVSSDPTSTEDSSSFFTGMSGMILMLGYLVFDAFTTNWQKTLFDTRPKVSRMQMMLGVNAFSAVLCVVSLAEQRTLFSSVHFAFTHSRFALDAFFMALSGACGQLFIYTTIEKFGPIVFTVMMTIRQMLSIVVSLLSYGHTLSPLGFIGFSVVFISIFLDIYRRYFEKRAREKSQVI